MKKTLLYSVIGLALVLGLILPMAVPVMASQIMVTKDLDPDHSPYDVGDTIYYVMSVTNPSTNTATNTLTRIWDTLPNGTVIEFLGASETLVQTPGDVDYFYAEYVADWDDADYGIVTDTFEAEGYDSLGDDVYGFAEKGTEVTEPAPPVGGEAFPIGKLSVLAPWIALGAAIVAGAAIFVRRRQVRS